MFVNRLFFWTGSVAVAARKAGQSSSRYQHRHRRDAAVIVNPLPECNAFIWLLTLTDGTTMDRFCSGLGQLVLICRVQSEVQSMFDLRVRPWTTTNS